ncbi:MAG TPA: hypothetical protein IGS37_18620 [Synechococcales cyanobacterium M55_K2018_004]|nr:hypothetical protein [Synechococcales cyanobacterium M55_K2018_004]
MTFGKADIDYRREDTGEESVFYYSNLKINHAIATLGSFDANATTGLGAFGYLGMEDNGSLGFNLTSPVSTSGPLYLYIGVYR